MVIGAVLLMITAILSQALTGKWKIVLWIVFTILLIVYTIVGIQMELDRQVEKSKEGANVSALNDKNKQILDVTQQLLGIVQSPNFAKNPETSSKIEKIAKITSSLENNSQQKASLQFSFWPFDKEGNATIHSQTVLIHNGIVEVTFSVKNDSDIPAKHGNIWLYICEGCSFAEEPKNLEIIKSINEDRIRRKSFDLINPGESLEPITVKIFPPIGFNPFLIAFAYACETCPQVKSDLEHRQILTVSY